MEQFTVQIFDANGDTVYQVKITHANDDFSMGILRAKARELCNTLLAHDYHIAKGWIYDE